MQIYIVGTISAKGSSDITFDQKYALTLYILLLTSLKKTGLSKGKTSETL